MDCNAAILENQSALELWALPYCFFKIIFNYFIIEFKLHNFFKGKFLNAKQGK